MKIAVMQCASSMAACYLIASFRFIVCTLVLGVCYAQRRPIQAQAEPQQYEDSQDQYQQPARQAPQQVAQQYQQEPRQKFESTTFIPIIRFDKEQGNDGSYKASWETGNNILAQEEGYVKNLGPNPDSKEHEDINAQVQQGSYSYTAPDGQLISVNYIADETGFHATGDHLPTPPPVSAEVQKGLDLIYAGIKAQQVRI
ncbi:unnamed protein product [Brassicogethes aeneus]|uniref:Uncharacterized protein n=1 Tax=Brassicogethes aeneus TaxID=1431903 RepID=A0A9P0FJZ1_BRAAE|nr:unnamed protein product [Brassicogethes aeneus]